MLWTIITEQNVFTYIYRVGANILEEYVCVSKTECCKRL